MNQFTQNHIRSHAADFGYLPSVEQKSIIQRITANLQSAVSAAGPYDNFALGVDVSGWVDPANVPLQSWHDNYNVEWMLARTSCSTQLVKGDCYDKTNYVDRTFPAFCDMAYNVKNKHGGQGLPFGGYHYWTSRPDEMQVDKREDDRQYQAFKAAFKLNQVNESIHFFEMDLEDKDNDTNSNISKKAKTWYHWMTGDPDLNPCYRLIYTSVGFITTYTPDSMAWIGQANSDVQLHMAQWPWAGGHPMAWDNLEKPNGVSKVLTPGNNPNRRFWQWAGDVSGLCKNAMDLNYFWGDWQALYTFLGFKPRNVTPVPDPDPVDPNDPPAPTTDLTGVISRLDAIAADVKTIKHVTDGIEAL